MQTLSQLLTELLEEMSKHDDCGVGCPACDAQSLRRNK